MLSAGVSTWPPCHGPVPPYSPASHWPTGHPQPFCSLELPRKLGLVLLYHLATSRAILPPALPTASLLPKDAALTASTKDQQMSAPQLSFLCPLISPINREPDFILLWKPLLSPNPVWCLAHSRHSADLCQSMTLTRGGPILPVQWGCHGPTTHTSGQASEWDPLLTLGKQLGHHVLTACLRLLRLARQAAVCRFQSLCLKQGKMF